MKDKLQRYALIAEILSALAIVLSLIFVGIQIQQNSRVNEVAAFQDLTSQLLEFNLLMAQDKTIRDILLSSLERDLNEEETAVLRSIYTGMVRHGEMAYLQYKNGFINESQLKSTLLPVTTGWGYPDMRDVFMFLSGFNLEYQEYVLSIVDKE